MSKILVTGAAGFIGARTVEILLDRDEEVIGIDNLNDYYSISLKKYRIENLLAKKNFKFLKLDIEDKKALNTLFSRNNINAVINLAARAGVRYSVRNPYIYYSTNVDGTLNLLEMMKEYEVYKMVLASTSSLYAGHKMPFRECHPVNNPISPYASSKKAAEVLAFTYHYLYGIDISVLRYFTVYGPAGRPDMSMLRFIKWIDQGKPVEVYGDGTQSRDFTYVDDIAIGTISALTPLNYEIINLGGGKKPVSINTLLNKIQDILGKKACIRYKSFHKTDLKKTWAHIKKAKKILNWCPAIDIDDGILRTVKWYKDNLKLVEKIAI